MPPKELHRAALQPTQIMRDDNLEGFDSDPMEKDATELELEKLVFGNEKGFHDDLKVHKKNCLAQYSNVAEEPREKSGLEVEDEGLEGLDDSAVRSVDLILGSSLG